MGTKKSFFKNKDKIQKSKDLGENAKNTKNKEITKNNINTKNNTTTKNSKTTRNNKTTKNNKIIKNNKIVKNQNLFKKVNLENYNKLFEREKNNRSQIFTLILIIMITIIISICLYIYLEKVQALANQNTLKSLSELTKQDVFKIENITNEHIRILETIVKEIEERDLKTINEVFNIFLRNSGSSQFSRICVMYENGKVFTNDEQIVDLSEEKQEFFENDEVKISQTRKSKIDEEEINIYSKTTKLDGEDVAILLVIETNKYEELFIQSIYNGNGNE